MLREDLIGLLLNDICEVVFIKVDGTPRTMICSLSKSVLPTQQLKEEHEKKTESVNKTHSDLITVYDTEKQEWRSLYFSRIQSVKIKIGV